MFNIKFDRPKLATPADFSVKVQDQSLFFDKKTLKLSSQNQSNISGQNNETRLFPKFGEDEILRESDDSPKV
jgi:hypothetical protein